MHNTILPIICDHVRFPDLTRLVDEPSTSLLDLKLDGIERTGISMAIEDKLHVSITQLEMDAWGTVADIVACAAGKVGERV